MAETKLNNFQQLEEQQINELLKQTPHVPPKIEMGVMGNVRTMGYMGDILELYLPRVIDLFISLFGGRRDKSIHKNSNNDFTQGEQKSN
jgi:hypothetical protein